MYLAGPVDRLCRIGPTWAIRHMSRRTTVKESTDALDADLVLEGGGVKGIALVGAISVLEEHGYRFHKVAGHRRRARGGSGIREAAARDHGRS
jgi:hypothetical protein